MRRTITTLILIFAMVFANLVFSFAVSDPGVTLVNPISNSVTNSSNLLISVKLEGAKTIKVSAYEIKKNVQNPAWTPTSSKTVPQYITQSLGDSDMKALTEGKFDWKGKTYVGIHSENFTSSKKLSFYTKKLEKINPGIYAVKVETLVGGKTVYEMQTFTQIQEKEKQEEKLFTDSQSGAGALLQGLVKTVFGN